MPLEMKPVDRAEVVILVDNYCEQVMLSSDQVTRPGGLTIKIDEPEPEFKAEHGFSALVRLFVGGERHTVMIDAGRSGVAAVGNAFWAGVDLDEVEALVVSHGHWDHVGGIAKVAEKFSHPVRVIAHPDAFLERYVKQPSGGMMRFPDFRPDLYSGKPLVFETHREPVLLASGWAATTGEVPRRTDYEKGFPPQLSVRDGKKVPDVEVWDDQALLFLIKDQGPVIISGCGHAGIVNTVRYSLALTGAERPLAVIGGFHLCWPIPEEVVRRTLDDLRELNPRFLVPCHCTGWETTHRIAREMPERFLLSTVGCTIRF